MDKYEVRLMNQALRDLDDIYAYIAGNLLEPGVAAEMVDALESEILSLNICHIVVQNAAQALLQTADTGSSWSRTTLLFTASMKQTSRSLL